MPSEFFNRSLNNRNKTYTQKKLTRLCEYFKGRITLEQDACCLYAHVKHGGRTETYLFHVRP